MQTRISPSDGSANERTRRSLGQIVVARSLWYVKPGVCELRNERLLPPPPGEARVETHFSALSRGTEGLVFRGEVPEAEWTRMRAPLQAGNFPFPVKYGYAAAGVVSAGPDELIGRRVFALHPHQDFFQVPTDWLHAIPDNVPTRRAVLAANMETALNAHWDAGTGLGDRILVVGAGVLGLLIGHLARRIAGTEVAIADIDAGKARIADALGLRFTAPKDVPRDNRIVFHTSATSAGLQTALSAAAFEARIMELSWYGSRPATINLGDAFHSQRLQLQSSQVGHVAPSHRGQVSRGERLQRALRLLDDPALDAIFGDDIAFNDVPAEVTRVFSGLYSGAAPVIRYHETRD